MRTHTTRTLLMLLAIAVAASACDRKVKDDTYEVCAVGEYAKPYPHLNLWDQIQIRKGEPVSSVIFTTFDPPLKEPIPRGEGRQATPGSNASMEAVPMTTCCAGERLGGTKTFLQDGKPVLHLVVIEKAVGERNPGQCTRKPLLTIRFCSQERDDKGNEAWDCGHNRNPHGGDVHAQPQSAPPPTS